MRYVSEYSYGSLLSTTSYSPDGSKLGETKAPRMPNNDSYRKKAGSLHTRR